MLTRRILKEIFTTAIYFAFCGAFWCALLFMVQNSIAAVIICATNMGGTIAFARDGGPVSLGYRLNAAPNVALLSFLPLVAGHSIFSLFLFGGVLLFFVAGCVRGKHPINRRETFTHCRRTALKASYWAGWGAALSGMAGMIVLNELRSKPPLHSDMTYGFVEGLLFGSVVGLAIGALAPGAVEQAQDFIKSSFASVRRT